MENALAGLPPGERVLALVMRRGGLSIADLRRLLSEKISDTLQLLIRGTIWEYVDARINWAVDKAAALALSRETRWSSYTEDPIVQLRWLTQFFRSEYSQSVIVHNGSRSQRMIDQMMPVPQFRADRSREDLLLPSPDQMNRLPCHLLGRVCKHLNSVQDLRRVLAACRSRSDIVQACKERLSEVVRGSVTEMVERSLALDRLTSLVNTQAFYYSSDSDNETSEFITLTEYPVDYYEWETLGATLAGLAEPVWMNAVDEWRSRGVHRVEQETRNANMRSLMSKYRSLWFASDWN